MSAETWTRDQLAALVLDWWQDETPKVMEMVDRWLARGDGAAVYRNHDLGSRDVGLPRIVSYGSPDAQLEVPAEELPEQLPDGIGGGVNWRYRLEYVVPGKTLEERTGLEPLP